MRIASTAEEFVRAIDESIKENAEERIQKAEEFLAAMSWDKTYDAMSDLIEETIVANEKRSIEVTV